MQSTRFRVDEPRKRVEVSVLELGQLSVLDELHGEIMPLLRQLRENTNISRWSSAGPLEDRKVQLSKHYLSKLWIGVDVELLTCSFVDLFLDCLARRLKALFERGE